MASRRSSSSKSDQNWSDTELRTAIDAYVFMLQLEISGIPFSLKELSVFLQNGPLQLRNEASIRYRMRNISHVFIERSLPRLKAFSPAPQVGSGVRERIKTLLDERSDALTPLRQNRNFMGRRRYTKQELLAKLDQLDEELSNLDSNNEIGIGHNNPPDAIELDEIDIESAKDNVIQIKQQVNSGKPNKIEIERSKNILIKFGLKLSIWIGSRITDFSKAAAIVAGTGFGAWTVGLVPKILNTLEFLTSYIQTLLNIT